MSKIDDGGSAFPASPEGMDIELCRGITNKGMSLRDWFAGQVLNNFNMYPEQGFNGELTHEEVAAYCYKAANAMIAERNKNASNSAS